MRRMLTTATAAAALFCFAGNADAQTIGAKLGASFANLSIDPEATGTSGTTGFVGGGFIRFGMGMLGLQGELLSVTKGADIGDSELRLEYVEIPVLLHASLMPAARFSPYVFAGPTVSLEVSCDAEAPGIGSYDCDDDFRRKSTDFGLAGGGGITFGMGPGSFLIEGRYTYGLTDLNDSETGASVKNRAAYLMAGYSIPLVRGF